MGNWSDYKEMGYQTANKMGPYPYSGLFLDFAQGRVKEGLVKTFNKPGFHTNDALAASTFPLLHTVTGDQDLMRAEPRFRKAAFYTLIGLSHPLRSTALSGDESAQARARAKELFLGTPSKGNLKFMLEAAHALAPGASPDVPFTLLAKKLRADGYMSGLDKIDGLFDRREEKVKKFKTKGREASESLRAQARYGL